MLWLKEQKYKNIDYEIKYILVQNTVGERGETPSRV